VRIPLHRPYLESLLIEQAFVVSGYGRWGKPKWGSPDVQNKLFTVTLRNRSRNAMAFLHSGFL
ncbi:hypothetical protein ACP43V_17545, partial [Vibrio genomosp. F10 str. 9ZC157]|uniref:hypothetical protein n=1 Tax=Vibrio genomosp. F10 TaxID=723171 RepID=UPI001A7E13D1